MPPNLAAGRLTPPAMRTAADFAPTRQILGRCRRHRRAAHRRFCVDTTYRGPASDAFELWPPAGRYPPQRIKQRVPPLFRDACVVVAVAVAPRSGAITLTLHIDVPRAGLLDERRNLVYLSVVKVVDREMNDIDDATLEKGVDGSWLAGDWRSLQEVLTLRRSVAKISKEEKGSSRTLCDSKKCGKMAPKKELQRCGGCLNVFYCSKQCQKEAWPNHRALCRLRTEDRATQTTEDRNALFPKADAQFFRELLSTDAGLHLGHMQNLAKREFPREKQGEYFALCLDYTDLRYPTGTCSLKDIRTYTAPPMNGEDEDEEVVVEHNKEMVRMVLRDPKAYTFIEATFAWGERRMSRNFMIRPNIWDKHVPQMVNFLGKKMCANEDVEENTPGFMKHLMNLGL
ncbi:hypothetical protein R3P38DRAFT_3265884 [Favolaschia claudopus]|uniref:MYND-type domain-containing protein n=1 Tax=Favolaschia claudopus TaxID=2862362 RepID=A0AAW0BYY7_9AGAR